MLTMSYCICEAFAWAMLEAGLIAPLASNAESSSTASTARAMPGFRILTHLRMMFTSSLNLQLAPGSGYERFLGHNLHVARGQEGTPLQNPVARRIE